MSICAYDEAYSVYDAEEIGWCAKCTCDPSCVMARKRKQNTSNQQNAVNLLEKQIRNASISLLNAVQRDKPMDEQMNLRRKLDALNWLLNLATAAGGC